MACGQRGSQWTSPLIQCPREEMGRECNYTNTIGDNHFLGQRKMTGMIGMQAELVDTSQKYIYMYW